MIETTVDNFLPGDIVEVTGGRCNLFTIADGHVHYLNRGEIFIIVGTHIENYAAEVIWNDIPAYVYYFNAVRKI